MGIFESLSVGFAVSLTLNNVLFCFAGTMLGLIVGILPGLGSAATIAMLLPVTYHLDATTAIITLVGIWYGSMFGGGLTAILLGIPGQSTAVMTVMDGHAMARKGQAGLALGTATFSSFIGGVVGFLGIILVAPPLAEFALAFGPPEYVALTLAGLMLASYLATDSLIKALISAVLGLLLGCVGLDLVTAQERLTYGTLVLQNGVSLVPLIMGLFGVAEIFKLLEEAQSIKHRVDAPRGFWAIVPGRAAWLRLVRPVTQGSLVGFLTGLLPGAGAAIASYVAYALAKRWSKTPEQFGKGAIEGVAAPEAANNAATGGDLIPLLALGLPADVVPAIMLGAFLLHGVTPGPTMITEQPEMFWGIVTSLFVGNMMLLLVVLPVLRPASYVARMPSAVTAPLIMLVTLAGAFGINSNVHDIYLMLAFGILGYLMNKASFPVAPLVLAFVLGPIMETSLRQSLIISHGSFYIFFERPVSLALIAVIFLVFFAPTARAAAHVLLRRSD